MICDFFRLAYKPTDHRAAMQVPFIVRYPEKFEAGKKIKALIDLAVDTMPTLLELCGIAIPEAVQGTSYLPLLEGSADEIKFEKETFNHELVYLSRSTSSTF